MFDFNCDLSQGYGIYKNDLELEVAKHASSANVSAGFHAGDALSIRKSLLFIKENNIALGAHIGYPDIQGFGKRKMDLDPVELEAIITYQIGAISSYAETFDLIIEQVRTHGALKEAINDDPMVAEVTAQAIKKINPWLNLIVQSQNTKELVESIGVKSALEADYQAYGSMEAIQNSELVIDTVHFKSLEDILEASKNIEPRPISYNRVEGQI